MENHQIKNIIFVNAQTQYENLGDVIILKTLLEKLRNYGNLIIDERYIPAWLNQELEIKNAEKASEYNSKFLILVLSFAIKSLFNPHTQIYYFLNPGHYLSRVLRNQQYIKHLITTIKTVVFLTILKILGVRICRLGVSIGPFSKIDQIVEVWLSKIMYCYSVRDTKSEKYAKQLGINKVEIFPDMAWLMKTPKLEQKILESEDDYVIFSFRKATNPHDDPNTYKTKLFPVLDEIVNTVCVNWQKRLVISYQVETDYEFCQEISHRYKDNYNVTFIEQSINSHNIYELYSRAHMVFSNRLHVLMFSMVCNSLPIAVVDGIKHDKITGLYSDAGLNQLIIDISNEVPVRDFLNQMNTNYHAAKEKTALCIKNKQQLGDAIIRRVMMPEAQ
ncbi:polysaccharide pyruvyl transferase family protein [Nostoc sp. TCL26-01]|uniref:polysaccharide pyruvyl transferase family protein n=1 Tax=Nostoc sp. TCL26-01 TaxID=2576904 RepID=UPI0015B845E6|nr:polysaccharide pyruvyl transferase family protein [Nostoc sp. TCL26-01]QLE56158.1 polysaccharide pyruvyl transferase family protein [Nostoc sp. TCL26-01]